MAPDSPRINIWGGTLTTSARISKVVAAIKHRDRLARQNMSNGCECTSWTIYTLAPHAQRPQDAYLCFAFWRKLTAGKGHEPSTFSRE
jgi:hypothetical protein